MTISQMMILEILSTIPMIRNRNQRNQVCDVRCLCCANYLSLVMYCCLILSLFLGIVDVLDINWASLAKEPTSKEQTHKSALKRFTASNILSTIGISRAYAGDKLTNELIDHCQRQMDEEAAENEQEGTIYYPGLQLSMLQYTNYYIITQKPYL